MQKIINLKCAAKDQDQEGFFVFRFHCCVCDVGWGWVGRWWAGGWAEYTVLGPVVQSVVSLTSSLRVISLTALADSIYNILIFFAEKM